MTGHAILAVVLFIAGHQVAHSYALGRELDRLDAEIDRLRRDLRGWWEYERSE